MHLDSLARPFYTVQHNRTPDSSGVWQDDLIHSYEVLDITGNRLAVHDGRGLVPLSYKYNLVKAPGYQLSIDGGSGRMLMDVGGQPLYHWDADDKVFHSVYDALRRPLAQWGDGKKFSKIIYGEGAANDTANNLRGQVLASYDGAGKHYVDAYDFKGQSLKSYMRLLADGTLADANWDAGGSALVTDELFFSEVLTDALGRPLSADSGRITGATPTTEHNITMHTYEKDGALKTVKMGSDNYVQDIHHNAKGQREAIWYGNGTKTSYTYDDKSHRLTRLLTVKLGTNDKLQDLNYFYDAVGNITTIKDGAQQTIFFNNTVVTPDTTYTYDALYRLIKAEGREQIGWASTATATPFNGADNTADNPWANQSHKGNGAAVQSYTQRYRYDAVGNILELKHIAADGSYTRSYTYATGSNRLAGTSVGTVAPALSDSFSYSHDARGNMTQMPHLSAMSYDLLNQMRHVTARTTEAYYQYSGGQRSRKYLDKGSSVTEERIYFGSYEVYRKFTGSSLNVERTTLHVADDTGRIAMIEKRLQGSDGSVSSLKRFIYSNHLQSASLELDETGAIISYEEYHPYGTTAYQAMNATINAVAKRYRYTGKERDEESGLNYHGARYYALWLCQWCAVDPLESKYTPYSSYCYLKCNPVNDTDSTGMGGDNSDDVIYNGGVLQGATVTAHGPKEGQHHRAEWTDKLGIEHTGDVYWHTGSINTENGKEIHQNWFTEQQYGTILSNLWSGQLVFSKENVQFDPSFGAKALDQYAKSSVGADFWDNPVSGRHEPNPNTFKGITPVNVEFDVILLLSDAWAARGLVLSRQTGRASSEIILNSQAKSGTTLYRTIVEEVPKGASIEDLKDKMKTLTYQTGNEHALVKFSDGNRYLVSGGTKGISFSKDELRLIYGHTHPKFLGSNIANNGPSVADYNAIFLLNQSKQRVFYEGVMETIFNQRMRIEDLKQIAIESIKP